MANTLMNTYARLPIALEKGEGAYVWDTNGKQYLDALSGIAVTGLGHAHPDVTQAICQQADRLLHTSNIYQIPLQQKLADTLCRLSGMSNVFFSNSGAEANEAAIKLARLFGHNKGIDNPAIIVCESSFHGRTLATLSATGNPKIQAGFEPLVSGFIRVPYNDIEAIQSAAANNPNIVAVLIEPIQGEGGINVPADDYLNVIRTLCDEHDWLMMLDEIQTGMGRTGKMFAFQHNNIMPDVVTLAKALGNGLPIGACLAHGKATELFGPGKHGSTFGGNPLACATAQAVCDVIERDQLFENARNMGQRIRSKFLGELSNLPGNIKVRGKGLMIGIELPIACAQLVQLALEEGLLINVTAEKVIRLLPPLIFTAEHADELANKLTPLIRRFTSGIQY